jgi:hypothetical protein
MVSGLSLFLRNNICVLINVVPFKVVSWVLYTASPAIALLFAAFREVRCLKQSATRDFVELWEKEEVARR